MTQYVINSQHGVAIYDLLAVSNHYGGLGGGHYTVISDTYLRDQSILLETEILS